MSSSSSFRSPSGKDFNAAVDFEPPQGRIDPMHIICVGVVFMDTKVSIAQFPERDSKTSAEKITRRRGGNPANSLEVVSDLLEHVPSELLDGGEPPAPLTKLHLITVLPEETSIDSVTIRDSIPKVKVHGLYREGFQEASSSVIIQDDESGSRTIMSNLNGLAGMTSSEFLQSFDRIVDGMKGGAEKEKLWVHFEGRNPDILLECIQALRKKPFEICISVECENPNRHGLLNAAYAADIVFFSMAWVLKNTEHENPLAFLEAAIEDSRYTQPSLTLFCTWGAHGTAAVRKSGIDQDSLTPDASTTTSIDSVPPWTIAKCPAYKPGDSADAAVVETTGAGDTFIAGILFLRSNYPTLSLHRELEFATMLASRKVYQVEYKGLGESMLKRSSTHTKWEHRKDSQTA
ncbi:Ribokinase-like protein [Paraphoma chrysanthemicola]|nr:Ribokinase-like protein [Paraphoma chrysanthemicola]